MYALERLGQDNPKLRQTVIDVICAYLRMPFAPPAEVLRGNAEHSPCTLARDDPDPEPDRQPERRQELQVRLTAQRLLRDHTRASGPDNEPVTYWRGPAGERMNLDLGGAVLVFFDLGDCEVGAAVFGYAQFHGGTDLVRAQFHGSAALVGARFYGFLNLRAARFHGHADLTAAAFHGVVDFADVRATDQANLPEGCVLVPEMGEPLRRVACLRGVAEAAVSPPATAT